jgi:hypothetical protein
VQKNDQQRDIETIMAYLLTSGVGYGISLFGDMFQLYQLENGTFAVSEAIILTRWSNEEREEEKKRAKRVVEAGAPAATTRFTLFRELVSPIRRLRERGSLRNWPASAQLR